MKDKVFDLVLFWGIYMHGIILFVVLFLYAKTALEGVLFCSLLLVFTFIGFILSGEITNEEI